MKSPFQTADDALAVPFSRSGGLVARSVVQPLQAFMHTEVAGGVIILAAAIVALVWANVDFSSYDHFWHTELGLEVGSFSLTESLSHWVNDLLMAVFFFVVGLEIKREIVHGDLRDPRAAALPLVAALGGMVVPAALYLAFNAGGPGVNGWGIPMATDIAFAVGVLALVGKRAPATLKIFLLTLAVADDLGAIIVIALFYSSGVAASWLGLAAAVVVAIVLMQRARIRALVPYVLAAAVLWLAVFESGVHATLAGVALGFLTPARPFHAPEAVARVATRFLAPLTAERPADDDDEDEQQGLLVVSDLTEEAVSPLTRLEHKLHPWTAYVILPVFALANAGVVLSAEAIGGLFSEPITLGVIAGLVLGKPLGVMLAAFLAVKSGLGRLPARVGWLEMLGVSALAGVGFTVSIFIAGLAFTDAAAVDSAKIGILAASLTAGLIGFVALYARDASQEDDDTLPPLMPESATVTADAAEAESREPMSMYS